MRFPTLICPFLALGSLSAQADLPIAIPAPAADISTTYGTLMDDTSANAAVTARRCFIVCLFLRTGIRDHGTEYSLLRRCNPAAKQRTFKKSSECNG